MSDNDQPKAAPTTYPTTYPTSAPTTSRRKFIVRGAIGSIGVLALGTYVFRNPIRRKILGMVETTVPPYMGSGTEPNLWFEITKDNGVILHSPKVEMGQGTFTGFAQMVADELDVSIAQIQVVAAATDTGIVDNTGTGGSLSVASLWVPLRELAATMREMLKIEAANKLGVALGDLSTKDGIISGGGSSLSYADIALTKSAAGVTAWTIPKTPKLRALGDYKHIGSPTPRIDLVPKVFGHPIFGMDAEMPGMLYAVVIRPEHVGASFKSADTRKADSMPGVVKVLQMDDWVGVIAETHTQALRAQREITVDWEIPKIWTETGIRELLQVGNGTEMITQKEGDALDPEDKNTVSLAFSSPIGAHAQIEPNGAVASVKDGKATIILSTQVIGITQKLVAKALGFKTEKVNIIPTFLGGGFGRRLNTNHAIQAAQMSEAVGKPVKYFFTRKEEFQHDLFRPPTHHIMRGRLSEDKRLDSIEHHYASGDVAINSVMLPAVANKILGTDFGAMRGGNIQYDRIPNHRSVQWHTTLPFATSWWRSLGLLANTFAIESFVDEMAIKAGKDPVTFRLEQIGHDDIGQRLKAVIQKAADEAGYTDEAGSTNIVGKENQTDRAMGLAASVDAGAPCAHVVEVTIKNGAIRVEKVTCVFDCGIAVNPDQVRAQCEGCIVMGISASLHEKMTLIDGQLFPTIYGPYDMALMRHTPKEIDIHLIQGADKPLPVGEPPLGPIAAAIGNAVRRITGQRLTDLPMRVS